MTTLSLIGPPQLPASGELRLTAQVQASEGALLELFLPAGVELLSGAPVQALDAGDAAAEFDYVLQLAAPLSAPIRARVTTVTGQVQEQSYPAPASLSQAPGQGIGVASLLLGAASLAVGVYALLQSRGTRRQVRARDEDDDRWLRSNYDLWRGQEIAAVRAKRAARRARRTAPPEGGGGGE